MDKIKAISPQIIVTGDVDKPYYHIHYYDTTDNKWHIGYGSYHYSCVREWLSECFIVIKSDVAPIRHGKWKYNENGGYVCSECNCWLEDYYGATPEMMDYCFKCGARMDGNKNG